MYHMYTYCFYVIRLRTFHLWHCPFALGLLLILRCFFGFAEPSDVDPETALAGAQGFLGCLSAVQLSHVAPLKAALHPSHPAPITVSGHVTESSCVAQAGTDATSRERTHSFAGGLRLCIHPVTHTCPLGIEI